jgi:predicted dehydrogenase
MLSLDTLKIGIVGGGRMADMHVRGYDKLTGARVAAICSRRESSVEKRKQDWHIEKGYTSYQELLKDPEIDAVDIVAPNNLHAPVSIAALDAGKHVFCEKPPALNAREAAEMMRCAQRNKRILMYGFMFRFSEKMRMVREFIQKGLVGEIYYIKAGVIRRHGNPGGWFTSREMAGGGALMDVGVHLIDLALFLVGDPEPASAFGRTFQGIGKRQNIKWRRPGWVSVMPEEYPSEVEDMAVAMINFVNGSCLSLETSFSSHIKDDMMYLEILGSKGGITAEPKLEIHKEEADCLVDVIPRVDCEDFNHQESVDREISHFVDCILEHIECESPSENGVKVMRIVDGIYSSAKTGKVSEL